MVEQCCLQFPPEPDGLKLDGRQLRSGQFLDRGTSHNADPMVIVPRLVQQGGCRLDQSLYDPGLRLIRYGPPNGLELLVCIPEPPGVEQLHRTPSVPGPVHNARSVPPFGPLWRSARCRTVSHATCT